MTDENTNTVPEVLSDEQLLSTKFEPRTNRRFIVEFGGIDSFLIKSVHTPPLLPNKQGKFIPKHFHVLRLFLHCPISPSLEPQLADAIKEQNQSGLKPAKIKYLNQAGVVVSTWAIYNPKIEEVKFTNPDYSNGEIMECELIVSFSEIEILF